ncbi:MAG: RagB/SusD family nutrient uptake outer membrane protein [Prevotella sp.]|nr:RagB/SusD family nutrient uptake outer membrane protein [Prevotella sp.]
MKNKYIGVSILSLALTLASCDDYLDKLPDNRMELSKPEEVSNLLVSAYSETNPAYLLEMYSDNADLCQNSGWTEASRFQRQAFEWTDITETGEPESPQELWNAYYKAISASNASIEYIDKLSAEQQEYSDQLGEALICRAYNMFILSTVFCDAYDAATAERSLGLPYPEATETTVGQKYERGTLKALYEKIDADLQRGLPLVKNNYTRPKFHFTQKAAYAFATRFYLYYQKYDESIKYGNLLLGETAGAMDLRDWSALYGQVQNRQVAPEFFINADHACNLLLQVVQSQWGAISGPYQLGDRYAHGDAISKHETMEADFPWGQNNMYAYVWSNRSLSKFIFRKVPYEFEYTDLQAGIGYPHAEYAVLTTDIALLERAEANALAGHYDAALADLNAELAVFTRNGYQATIEELKKFYDGIEYYEPKAPTPKKKLNKLVTDTEKQEPLLQAILQLKRVMTLHEGFRLQDIKRYGITMYRRVMNSNYDITDVTDTMEPQDPRLAIQLPQDVLTGGLEPNPRTK